MQIPSIFKSKKFQAALVGLIVITLRGLVPDLADIQIEPIVALLVSYILGQGLADLGKEAEHVKRDPTPTYPTAKEPMS
jgi:hypothetical protein